jgi:hypothetical protein
MQKKIEKTDEEGVYLVLSSNGKTQYRVDTNIQSCECEGYKFRHTCRHLKLANKQLVKSKPNDCQALSEIPEEGIESHILIDLIGRELYFELIMRGEIYEDRGIT